MHIRRVRYRIYDAWLFSRYYLPEYCRIVERIDRAVAVEITHQRSMFPR